MSQRATYRDERDVPGEMGWDRAEAIATQDVERAQRELERVQFLRHEQQEAERVRRERAAADAELQEVRNAIATEKARGEASLARDEARRAEAIATLDAVIAAKNEEAARATARAEQAEAGYQRWLETRPRPEPARA